MAMLAILAMLVILTMLYKAVVWIDFPYLFADDTVQKLGGRRYKLRRVSGYADGTGRIVFYRIDINISGQAVHNHLRKYTAAVAVAHQSDDGAVIYHGMP